MDISLSSSSKIKFAVTNNAKLNPTQLVAIRLKSFSITGLISQQIAPPGLPAVVPGDSARASNNQPNLRPVQSDLDNLKGTIALSIAGQSYTEQASTISWATDGNGKLKNPSKFVDYLVFFGQVTNFLDFQLYVVNSKADEKANLLTAQSVMNSLAPIAGMIPGPGTIASAGLSLLGAITSAIANSITDNYELYYEGTKSPIDQSAPDQTIGTFEISRIPNNTADLSLSFDIVPFPDPTDQNKLVTIYLESLQLTSLSSSAAQIVISSTFGSGKTQTAFPLTLSLNQGGLSPSLYIAIDNKFLYQGAKGFGIPYSIDVAINATQSTPQAAAASGAIPATAPASTATSTQGSSALSTISDSINGMAKAAALPAGQIADVSMATKALQTSVALAMAFLPSAKQAGTAAGLILLDDQYPLLPPGVTGFLQATRNNATESSVTIPLISDSGAVGKVTLRIVESVAPPTPSPPAPGK